MTRLFALSDLHLDFPANQAKFDALSATDYQDAALLMPGDLTHDLGRLEAALVAAVSKFAEVFFVPGNHELWLREDKFEDSLAKFDAVLALCEQCGARTSPLRLDGVWVVPLFSWYVKPEEGEDSLHGDKPGEDRTLRMWLDNHFVRWPSLPEGETAADEFSRRNRSRVRTYDAPVVSLSHFLPRTDLMYRTPEERAQDIPYVPDRMPSFNFSSVAGTKALEREIRSIGSAVHVYGHQHRNRDRMVEGVRYVSHCLGYPREYEAIGEDVGGPLQVWPMGSQETTKPA